MEESTIKEKMLEQGVGKIFLNARLTDFPTNLQTITESSFFMYSAVGCGKTHLLAAIIREYIDYPRKKENSKHLLPITHIMQIVGGINKRIPPRFLSISDFLYKLKSSFSYENEKSEYELITEIINCPVLCLDDLGNVKTTDWNVQVLDTLLNGRYNNSEELRTYISSNWNLEGIADNFGERIASRIAGMCKTIKLTGKDRRLSENSKK